jgi:fibronectin-binding autotransporter adhesin
MKRILNIFFLLMMLCIGAHGQNLPSNPIGVVNYTSPGTYVNYSYSFTASATGVDYFGLAIRQDPGYWSIGNFDLTRAGSSTNLLLNPNLQYGGTTNTQYGLQAPADWGIWYQSSAGAPPAAGQYYSPGSGWLGSYSGGLGVNTSTAGSWIDGAVGTFDGIYQGINVSAGVTYNFSFSLNGTQSSSNPSIEIGAYAGACTAGTTPFTCTPNTSSGFTAAATPQQTQGTGGAPTPPPPAPSGPQFTDLRFSGNQIADTQWNVGSCTNAGGTNCQIYSKNPGPTWNTGSPVYPSSTQYIAFTATGDSTNPWHMWLYNSDGSVAQDLGVGHILSEGLGSDGHHYFFFSNANYNGTLFCTDWGMNNTAGLTINGTNSPTVPQTNDFASSGSTTPLASGATSGGNSAPTVTGTSTTNTYSTTTSGNTVYTYATPVTTTTYSDGSTTTTTGTQFLYSTAVTNDSTSTSSTSSNSTNNTYNNQTSFGNNGTTIDTTQISITGVDTTTVTTTATTPVTTTTYSDGSTSTSYGTTTYSTSSSDSYTVTSTPLTTLSSVPDPGINGNSVYIQQVTGYNDTWNVTQYGNYNSVTGVNNQYAMLSGNNNNVITNQNGQHNALEIKLLGDSNNLNINQGYTINTIGVAAQSQTTSNNNIAVININGNGNSLITSQVGIGNLVNVSMNDSWNTGTIRQTGNNNQSYTSMNGTSNNFSVTQTGSALMSNINLYGNGNTANVTQTGNNLNSTISLTNSTGSTNTFNLIQTGPNDPNYSITQICTNPVGCSATVIKH